ncbi:MAG: radical SAM protein [Planctomycetota bacterium]
MKLIEKIVRASFPLLLAGRAGRRLPGRISRLLGREFLLALKKVNREQLEACEERGSAKISAYPGFITVAGTSRCNLRCEFCINQWDAAPDGSNRPHMDRRYVERIVNELFPYIDKIALSVSGEPLVDPHFLYLLEQSRKFGIFVEITTNAMLVSRPGFLDAILDSVGRVNISMDAATKETYERLRRGARFDKVCNNIRAMSEGRRARERNTPEFNIRCILMRDSIDELPQLVDLAKDMGVDHLFTNHIQVFMNDLADQSLIFHRERANQAFAAARERAKALEMVVVLPEDFDLSEPAPIRPETSPSPTEEHAASGADSKQGNRPKAIPPSAYENRCPYLWEQSFLEADGSVFPCCNAGNVAMGHLDKSPDFFTIWNGPAYMKMRETVYTPNCHNICVNCYLREDTRPSSAFVRPVEGAEKGGWQRK